MIWNILEKLFMWLWKGAIEDIEGGSPPPEPEPEQEEEEE